MGPGMLDWAALLPSNTDASPPENLHISPELGEIPPIGGNTNAYGGNADPCINADRQEISPISPISPEKNSRASIEEENAGGVCGQEDVSARVWIRGGDQVTCHQCGHLATTVDPPACKVASLQPFALVRAVRGYRPVIMPHRCPGFVPLPDDPDQRLGVERWPGLRTVR